MIITDGTHLSSTESELELHRFAARIGLKKRWYVSHQKHPHYILSVWYNKNKVNKCGLGVTRVSPVMLLKASWWAEKKQRIICHRGGGKVFVDLLPYEEC